MNDGEFIGEIPPEQRRLMELQARRRAERKRYRATPSGRAEHNRSKRNWRMNKRLDPPFVGVDGEGSEQAYLLLRAGDSYLHTGKPLTYRQCFDFLCDLPDNATYVAYFFDYDVTMMCRHMPEDRLQRLLAPHLRTGKGGQQLPIDIDGFEIDYRPGKEFKVRRKGAKKWRIVNDVGAFFQCSFVKALTAWGIGSKSQMEQVKTGKDMRSDFSEMTADVIAYNATECELLAALMSKFGAACRGIKYLPRKWQGPGELAAAMLAFHGAPRRKELDNIPLDLWEAGNKAYYGGRFETTAIGHLRAPLYAYDINSAYPDAIRSLPCLQHGEWKLSERVESELSLQFGSFKPARNILLGKAARPYLYGLPFRTGDAHIIYPGSGRGWYWSDEIQAATHQTFRPEIVWNFEKRCDCTPFDWIEKLYTARKEWESQSDNPTAANMGIALKLALNSLYGKMAQSVGNAPYANPLYASLITARTRGKLYRMVHALSGCESGEQACGHSVFYLATDGLFAATAPSNESGRLLGEWSHETVAEDLLLVQPGLYLGAAGIRMKTRGIPKTKVEAYASEFERAWQALLAGAQPDDPHAMVEIPFHQFLGLKQAVHFRRLRDAGSWTDLPRRYGFDWQSKREASLTELADGYMRTLPPKGIASRETLGYSKDIGRWLDENREWFEQKVWGEAQPDGATWSTDRDSFKIEW